MFPKRLSIEIRWFALSLLVSLAAQYLIGGPVGGPLGRLLPALVLYALTGIVRLLLRRRSSGTQS